MTPKEWATLDRPYAKDLPAKPDGRGSPGYPKSPEHRQKISDATKGRVFSDEARANMSAASKGRPKSEEHKQKIREALIAARRT